jgi:hypothetical protein
MMRKISFFLAAVLACNMFAADEQSPAEKPYKPYYYDKSSRGIFVYGEWLRWTPFLEDSMNWVDKKEMHGAYQKDKIQSLKFDWNNGFRVGLGYRFARDMGDNWIRPWQLEAYYTHFHSHVKKGLQGEPSVATTQGVILYPVLPVISPNGIGAGYDLGIPPSHADSEAHLDYHTFDAVIAWPIWIRDNVILRLMAGGMFAKITDHWNTVYKTQTENINFLKTHTDFHWGFIGGGLELGADIHVALPQGLGFFLDGDCGLLIGTVHKGEKYKIEPITNTILKQNWVRSNREFEPMLRFEAGFDYKHWFSESWMLHLALSYEVQVWFNLNQFGKTNDRSDPNPLNAPNGSAVKIPVIGNFFDNDPSNLGFHGVNARVGLDF